ncbi:DUF4296 domain-containing protein [Vicingaceae bacterium]|jgi:hypothetical protein|nr:DUF4296 domain-containing protein [Vicingaceae bacterium]
MKKLLYTFLLTLLFSCSEEFEIPKVVLNQEKMVEVMTDIQIAESYIKLKFAIQSDTIQVTDSIYSAIYRKHHISAQTYDTSFQFYTKHPNVFQVVYEQVISNLGTIEALNESSKKQSKPAEVEPPIDLVIPQEN